MPIYEYRCDACGHELEAIQKISDAPLTECPACGAAELRKLVSAAGFQLKGSGWYVTDFKDKKKKKTGADAKGGDGKKPAEQAKPAASEGTGDAAKKSGETAGKAAKGS